MRQLQGGVRVALSAETRCSALAPPARAAAAAAAGSAIRGLRAAPQHMNGSLPSVCREEFRAAPLIATRRSPTSIKRRTLIVIASDTGLVV
jgi:hypothetical protein